MNSRFRARLQATKKPAQAGFFVTVRPESQAAASGRRGCLERLDMGVQTALVTRGLVLVDQATAAEPVKQRLSGHEGGFGSGDVVGVQRLDDFLDGSAHHRARAGVTGATDLGLTGALLGGLDVCHYCAPGIWFTANKEAELCGTVGAESMRRCMFFVGFDHGRRSEAIAWP